MEGGAAMKIDEKIFDIILRKVLALKSSEGFLVVADPPKESLARQLFEYSKKITQHPHFKVIKELDRSGQEPEPGAAELMLGYDVQFYWTSKSLSHTLARRRATEKRFRIISAPMLTEDIINRCVDIDYDALVRLHEKLRPVIANSKEIRVTSGLGTDITTTVHDTHGARDAILMDQPGSWGNLPVGEVDSGVVRKKTNGRLVFDGSFPGIGLLKKPIKAEVFEGTASFETDHPQAKDLYRLLESVGPGGFKVAELGIGTNSKALLTGIVLEDEKVLGTVHFAFGNDLTYNGDNDVPLHLDGVIKDPNIYVDGQKIMEKGKFI